MAIALRQSRMIPVISSGTYPEEVGPQPWDGPTDQLTHRWPMDDANVAGTTITDVVGTDHGTAGVNVSSVAGPYTQARFFPDGANSGIVLGSTPIANLAASWSAGFWVMDQDIAVHNTGGGVHGTVFGFRDGTNGAYIFEDHVDAGGINGSLLICKGSGGGGGPNGVSGAVLVNNVWKHIVLTYDGATTILYVNAVSVALSGVANPYLAPSNSTFGTRDSNSERPLVGAMYQFVTYTKALSGSEVTQLYTAED